LDTMRQASLVSWMRHEETILLAQAMQDATNITLRRYIGLQSNGLICGLPLYKAQAFANVQRHDGWYFLFGVAFPDLPDADPLTERLAYTLEESDLSMLGPGSASFGDLSSVTNMWQVRDGNMVAVVIELRVYADDQQASFFGQDLAQSSFPPCALGDM